MPRRQHESAPCITHCHCGDAVKHEPKRKRRINDAMARGLIAVYNASPYEYVKVPPILVEATGSHSAGGDFAKLRHWGLIEQQPGVRGDGSTRTGWYRITPTGRGFVQGWLNVPKYRREGKWEPVGPEMVRINDCLNAPFRYDELMTG